MQNTKAQENLCWVNCLSCCQSLNRTLSIHVLSQGNKVLEGSDGEDLACSLREPLPVPREEEEEELRSSQGKAILEELAPGKYSDGQEQGNSGLQKIIKQWPERDWESPLISKVATDL